MQKKIKNVNKEIKEIVLTLCNNFQTGNFFIIIIIIIKRAPTYYYYTFVFIFKVKTIV